SFGKSPGHNRRGEQLSIRQDLVESAGRNLAKYGESLQQLCQFVEVLHDEVRSARGSRVLDELSRQIRMSDLEIADDGVGSGSIALGRCLGGVEKSLRGFTHG